VISADTFTTFDIGTVRVIRPLTHATAFQFGRLSQQINRVYAAQQALCAALQVRILQPVVVTGLITPKMLSAVMKAVRWINSRREFRSWLPSGWVFGLSALAMSADQAADALQLHVTQLAGVVQAPVSELPTLSEINTRAGVTSIDVEVGEAVIEKDNKVGSSVGGTIVRAAVVFVGVPLTLYALARRSS